MLVLVNAFNVWLAKFWFTQPLAILSAVILITVSDPAPLLSQAADGNSTRKGVSVLMQPNSASRETGSPAANGFASVENSSAVNSSTFTTRPLSTKAFPDEPQPPKELLFPRDPTPDSFTKPVVSSAEFDNDLRSGKQQSGVVTASFNSPQVGHSEAVGTLATTNQNRQNSSSFQSSRSTASQGPPNQFTRPASGSPVPDNAARPKTFSPPVVSSFGDSARTSRTTASSQGPSVASQAFSDSASRNSVMNNSTTSNSAAGDPSIPAASSWRKPDPAQSNQSQTNNASNYPSNRMAANPAVGTTRSGFNSNANSNYNQGVNPNIASGVPRVAPLQQLQPNRNIANQPVRRTQQSFNRDRSVQPTGFAQPAAPRKIRTDLAKQLIARYSASGMNPQELAGQPVRLIEMLNQPISTEQRRPMVHQFWDTYLDWASLVNSKQYLRLLNDIPSSSSAAEQAMLEMAKMEAKNEVLASEIELVKSQAKLTQFIPNRPASLPPLIPNELPLIQKYNTQYERYKQHQLMPVSLLGIDKMLPKTLELISSRADTVQLAQSGNQKVVAGVRNRQASVSDALHAAKAWRSAEQNLLVAVMDYNHAICDYALTVSRGYQTPQQVVGMLIAKPSANSANSANSNSSNVAGGNVADRFRNARNAVGNPQQGNSQVNNQRFNSQPNGQSQPTSRTANRFGGASSGPGNANGVGGSSNSGQAGFRPGRQNQQPAVTTVEAGSATPFRSTSGSNSGSFGNPNSGTSNAAKSPQGFNLGNGSGFKPPVQSSFGNQSKGGQQQFNGAPATSVQGQQPQSPQSDPFGRSANSAQRPASTQFQSFGR